MTFLRGHRQEDWSGADPGRLRSTVDLLVTQAFPPHPHASLAVPNISSGSLRPVSYTKIPPLDKLTAKLGALSSDQAVSSMTSFISARASTPASEIHLPDLQIWTTFLTTALTTLDPDSLFAAIDLFRCTILDPRVASFFSTPPTLLLSILNHVTSLPNCPYSLRLTTLQLSSTLFPVPRAAHTIFTTPLSTGMISLSASSLLSDPSKPALRAAAAALAFNLSSTNYCSRREHGVELLQSEAQVELLAALAEMFSSDPDAGDKEGAHAVALALAYLVYFADEHGEVLDLCRAMGVREIVSGVRSKEKKVKAVLDDLVKVLPE